MDFKNYVIQKQEVKKEPPKMKCGGKMKGK